VLGRQFAAVHFVSKYDVGTHRLTDRQAPRVPLGDAALDPGISAGEHHLHGVRQDPRLARRYASGTPVQAAVPTPSSTQGWLSGRGLRSERPLPAHSSVTGTVMAGSLRSAGMLSSRARSTAPLIRRCQASLSIKGMSKWVST
jgi:hypothetical protein